VSTTASERGPNVAASDLNSTSTEGRHEFSLGSWLMLTLVRLPCFSTTM